MSEGEDEKLDRREFLRRAGYAGLITVGVGQVGAACDKGGSGGGGSESSGGSEKSGGSKKGGGGGDELSCTDTSGLSEDEINLREKHGYVDKTEKPDQRCDNCNLYQKPDKEGTCGGCTLVPGPIHPKGWCEQWVAAS